MNTTTYLRELLKRLYVSIYKVSTTGVQEMLVSLLLMTREYHLVITKSLNNQGIP